MKRKVTHAKFGEGELVSIVGVGDAKKAEVLFPSPFGRKVLLASALTFDVD